MNINLKNEKEEIFIWLVTYNHACNWSLNFKISIFNHYTFTIFTVSVSEINCKSLSEHFNDLFNKMCLFFQIYISHFFNYIHSG